MKSVIYFCIAIGCAWVVLEPKNKYVAPQLPKGELYYSSELPDHNIAIDSLIIKIEKNLDYFKQEQLTQN
ncbi:hypothetical protein [Bizionia myxarmorum]|uniref:Uncharacterized protein n=1 Tax=Bizionia myxarmorum TaxID=291186 RepID=A0A5D0R9L6_9FLAO|nr:hypothetical protein [Bizionia myxarmorum]TYB78340.1 hypothetical protein ES674_00740 [Bizionia myxarmorum]